MTFRVVGRWPTATDDVTGVKVSQGYGRLKWDQFVTWPYYFSEGDMEFLFEAGHFKRRIQTDEEIQNFTCSIHIIEDVFKEGLIKAMKKAAKLPLTEQDYQRYRNLVHEGLYCLITIDEHIKKYIPDFKIYFEPDRASWSKKYYEALSKLKNQN